MLTDREKQILCEMVKVEKRLDDCCPDIGMGPSLRTLIERSIQRLPFDVDYEDANDIEDMLRDEELHGKRM